jgi:hypothetical protein
MLSVEVVEGKGFVAKNARKWSGGGGGCWRLEARG